ncbi:uncharacterized protein LOC122364162 [Amphibalanus amphitrite]|uniref:uncharacterized protein LOC122364162 n=1 Tax=Amphibalanus amphitrite TaxID=1232801 RepID=UPI001C912F4B|nr:uncharacterized protein LOC122364162 [Amphibalanus amphitrite]
MCGVVKTMLATALDRTQREWHVFLGASQYAVNSTFQTSNRWSPAFLMYGRQFRLPIEQALASKPPDYSAELSDLVTQLKERQYDAISKTIENQKTARRYQRDYYNRRARDKKYELGDLVYLYRPAVKPGDASKLTKKWEPGYVVVGLHDNGLTYEVRKPGSKHPPEKVHCDRLKPQHVSSVYRDALRKVHTFRRDQAPSVDSSDVSESGPDDEQDTDLVGLALPRPERTRPLTRSDRTGSDSGVTNVLETLGTNRLSSDSSETLETADSETPDDDGYYMTIPSPPVAPRRSSRRRQAPQRFSP